MTPLAFLTRRHRLLPVLTILGALATNDCPAQQDELVDAARIRSMIEGTWELETWHVGEKVLRPPQIRGYISFHDGVVLFGISRDDGKRTRTRFGHGEYEISAGRWAYRYDDNHFLVTQPPKHDEVLDKGYFSWDSPREFKATLESNTLVLDNDDGRRRMLYTANTQTYLENGEVVRTWKLRAVQQQRADATRPGVPNAESGDRPIRRSVSKVDVPNFELRFSNGKAQLIDARGNPTWILGVNHIGQTDPALLSHETKLRREAKVNVVSILKGLNFNCAGGDCAGPVKQRLPYFVTVPLTSTAHWMPPRQFAYEDIFAKEFAVRVEESVKVKCLAHRENPNLIGYYWTDTPRWDLSISRSHRGNDWVSFCRSLPADSPGKHAYIGFLREHFSDDIGDFNDAFRLKATSFEALHAESFSGLELVRPKVRESDEAFLGVVANRIYSVAAAAFKRHDPTALLFGEKFKAHDHPDVVLENASRHIDVISIQPGPEVGPLPGPGRHEREFDRAYFDLLHRKTGKPIMICDHAVSWNTEPRPVTLWHQYPTQAAAVESYRKYLQAAAATPHIIGYCRCQYLSEYRKDRRLLKQGLFDEHGQPYAEVMAGFRAANSAALQLRAEHRNAN